MFNKKNNELFQFLAKKTWNNETKLYVKRKEPVRYESMNIICDLIPLRYCDECELKEKDDFTHIMFVEEDKCNTPTHDNVRKLSNIDQGVFDVFYASCSKEDKDEGMVSLQDDDAYGFFIDDLLVCVSSTWYWGEKLADIGVLTHPNYRKQGIALKTVKGLMNEVDKWFLWRCDNKNQASYNLGISAGFEPVGKIIELKKVE